VARTGEAVITVADGLPLTLWAILGPDETALWSGSGWQDDDVARQLRNAGLRAVRKADQGIVVEPLLSYHLPSEHPDFGPRARVGDPAAAGEVASLARVLELAYDATRDASAELAARGSLAHATELLHRANLLLVRAESILGIHPQEFADLLSAVARLRDAALLGSTPQLFAAATGWFGARHDGALPRTVARLASLRRTQPPGTRPATRHEDEVLAALGRAVAALPADADHRALAIATLGDALAMTRLAASQSWPGLVRVESRLRRHPEYGLLLHGSERPVETLLMWACAIDVREGFVRARADAVRRMAGLCSDVLGAAPPLAAIGDAASAVTGRR
jgi:hypothetical protein